MLRYYILIYITLESVIIGSHHLEQYYVICRNDKHSRLSRLFHKTKHKTKTIIYGVEAHDRRIHIHHTE